MEQLATDFLSQQSGAAAAWIGGVAFVVYAIVKIKKAVSAVWPFVKKLVTVVEDLFGAEARPGVPARPGLMARMQTSEENDISITATLAEHSSALLELRPNHGGSMKDVLKATREDLAALREDLTKHITEQRTATVNAEASAIEAVAAVVSAKEAVVGAQEAVVAAAKERAEVHVNVIAGTTT
jgi:uncharacterized protein YicC (UPF0701 family)